MQIDFSFLKNIKLNILSNFILFTIFPFTQIIASILLLHPLLTIKEFAILIESLDNLCLIVKYFAIAIR